MLMSKSWLEVLKSKPVRRLKNLLTGGNLWLYVLSLIRSNKRVYAYNLDDNIEKEFFFRPSKPMVYIVLHKLEGEKLIKSEYEERRKYYTITSKGEQALESAKEYFTILSKKL